MESSAAQNTSAPQSDAVAPVLKPRSRLFAPHPLLTSVLAIATFGAIYLFLFFPSAYFRHDDWLLLGNSLLVLPRDWGSAWRSTLVFFDKEQVWFFRPFMRLAVYAGYQLFGWHYSLWLSAQLLLASLSVALGGLFVKRYTNSTQAAVLFLVLFVACLHLHFGSLVWIGEGVMNCPQVFLLMLSVFCFSEALKRKPVLFHTLSLATFVLSLGFKESSVFLPGFFLALLIDCSQTRTRWKTLIPYFTVAAVYLYIRLFQMPLNPGYSPQKEISGIGIPVLYLASAFGIPIIVWLLSALLGHRLNGFRSIARHTLASYHSL